MIDKNIIIDKLNNIKTSWKEYFKAHPRKRIGASAMDRFLDLLIEFIEACVEEDE